MITIEKILRRDDFSQGESFIGMDGDRWYFPIIDGSAWFEHEEIRDWYASSGKPKPPGWPSVEVMYRLFHLGSKLLARNYHFTDLDSARIPMDNAGFFLLEATGALFKTIHCAEVVQVSVAEIGVVCRDNPAHTLRSLSSEIAGGWNLHDGPLFDN